MIQYYVKFLIWITYSILSCKLGTSFLTFSILIFSGKNGKSLRSWCNVSLYWTSTSRKYPLSLSLLYFFIKYSLIIKKLGGGGSIWPHLCGFSKNVFSRRRIKPCFFVTFNIIISYILTENFIEIPHDIQKTWRFSSSILIIFTDFSGFFYIFLLQRNEWRRHRTDNANIFKNFNLL